MQALRKSKKLGFKVLYPGTKIPLSNPREMKSLTKLLGASSRPFLLHPDSPARHSGLQPLLFPINAILAPQPSGSIGVNRLYTIFFPLGKLLCLRERPQNQTPYKHPSQTGFKGKEGAGPEESLRPAEGGRESEAGGGGSRAPTPRGRPPGAGAGAPQPQPQRPGPRRPRSPGTGPAPGNAPCPDRAPLSCRSPRAGPQAPHPRARVAAAAGRGDPLAAAVLRPRRGPCNCRRCRAKAHNKGRGALPATPLPAPSTPFGGGARHPRTPKLRTPKSEPPTEENAKAAPLGAAGAAPSPSGRCPGRTITLKLWGRARERGAPKGRKWGVGGQFLYFCKMHFPGSPARLRPGPGFPRLRPAPRGPRAPPSLPRRPPGRAGPRPLPRRARAARSTHLGRAALSAGLRRAR